MNEKLVIIRTQQELASLTRTLESAEYVSYDTETTGLDSTALIIGMSVAADTDTGYYVVLRRWDPETSTLVPEETLEGIIPFLLSLQKKNLVMHNGVFDCARTRDNFQVDLMPNLHTDSMCLAHLLNENRLIGLKPLSLAAGDSIDDEAAMKASIAKNGGKITKDEYELYKGDSELIARYGAMDAIRTFRRFIEMVPQLYEQGLDKFFYEDETMPLLRGPTYDLNTTGLRVDPEKLTKLRAQLEVEILESRAYIDQEVRPLVSKFLESDKEPKYECTPKLAKFNVCASQQLSWLLFYKLREPFHRLTDSGREVCNFLGLKLPYALKAKADFIKDVEANFDRVFATPELNPKTGKIPAPKKIGAPWKYLTTDEEALEPYAKKYKWMARLLSLKKAEKLLSTYVLGIQDKLLYNVVHPSFKQCGTVTGRYSSSEPNFQNLPRSDKRIKSCIVARAGKVFVGADYSQLEPRVFASFSGDTRLQKCFSDGDDFYSIVGASMFNKTDCTLKKDGSDSSFPIKYPQLREIAKIIALALPYGAVPAQIANELASKAGIHKSLDECAEITDDYFTEYPSVYQFMLKQHETAKSTGVVHNLFGRPRRIPEAAKITAIYKNTPHPKLPGVARNQLNMGMNFPIQSTGASIVNRASIAVWKRCRELESGNSLWKEVKIVLQVHDEVVLEGPKSLANEMATLLRDCMENTTKLPNVELLAEPFITEDLAVKK